MSGLCGWLGQIGDHQKPAEALQRMAAALQRFDRATVSAASAPNAAIGIASTSIGNVSLFKSDSQVIVALWGQANLTDGALALLAKTHGVAYAIAHGYQDKGEDVVAAVTGSFALAILDGCQGQGLLALDRMATHPLFYTSDINRLVFGSTTAALTAFPGLEPGINQQAIYDYVHFHVVPGPESIYSGIRRLEPGCLLFWRKGREAVRTYWKIRYIEDRRRPFIELKSEFLTVLRTAVLQAVGSESTGTFLSGGTDSSTVAGLLGEVTGKPARTYSIGFQAEGYDETQYARLAASHFGTRHHEYYLTPDDVVAAIPALAQIHDQPFGNASAVPTYYCAKLAKEDGIDTLLAGDGGDELFGGNARYALQYVYSLYTDLSPALRERFLEPIAYAFPPIGLIGRAQRYMRSAMTPMPARYDKFNLLQTLGADNVFTAEFLRQVDTQAPNRKTHEIYQDAGCGSLINRMLAFDLKYTLADNDLLKVRHSCELAGVDVRFPMLTDAVVSFSAQLEPVLKLKRTQLRSFFKKALRGYLPDAILKKKKHGFGMPFGRWVKTHKGLREIALDNLSSLKKRNIVRSEFIDELSTWHLESHADYFGTMIWVLMMLELWFERQEAHKPAELASHGQRFADLIA